MCCLKYFQTRLWSGCEVAARHVSAESGINSRHRTPQQGTQGVSFIYTIKIMLHKKWTATNQISNSSCRPNPAISVLPLYWDTASYRILVVSMWVIAEQNLKMNKQLLNQLSLPLSLSHQSTVFSDIKGLQWLNLSDRHSQHLYLIFRDVLKYIRDRGLKPVPISAAPPAAPPPQPVAAAPSPPPPPPGAPISQPTAVPVQPAAEPAAKPKAPQVCIL